MKLFIIRKDSIILEYEIPKHKDFGNSSMIRESDENTKNYLSFGFRYCIMVLVSSFVSAVGIGSRLLPLDDTRIPIRASTPTPFD